jgi:hypothetical protein
MWCKVSRSEYQTQGSLRRISASETKQAPRCLPRHLTYPQMSKYEFSECGRDRKHLSTDHVCRSNLIGHVPRIHVAGKRRLNFGRCGGSGGGKKGNGLGMSRCAGGSHGGRGSRLGMGSYGCYTSLKGAIPQETQIMKFVLGF